MTQFKAMFVFKLQKLKINVKNLFGIAKVHEDQSGISYAHLWPKQIKGYLNDSIQAMKDILIISKFFPTSISLHVWACDPLIIIANYYLLIKVHKPVIWEEYPDIKVNSECIIIKKLMFKAMVTLIKRLYFGIIGNWGTGIIQKQNLLSKSISNFILQMTGNLSIDKDSVPPTSSIIEQRNGFHSLLKKLMKAVEFELYLYMIDDDVMKNRDKLIQILSEVYPHEFRNIDMMEQNQEFSLKSKNVNDLLYL